MTSTGSGTPSRAQTGIGFYGWWAMVPAAFLILTMTNGLTVGGIAAFDPSFIAQLGVTRADIKLGDAIQLGVTAILTVATGWLADRYGVRIVMAFGIAALSWAFFSLASVQTLADYYWTRFWMGIGLSGAGLAICVVAVSRWFTMKRGLALGLVLVGTSLGNWLFPTIFTRLIADQGLREAAHTAAWMIAALALVVALLVREWPDRIGLKPYGAELVDPGKTAQQLSGPELTYAEILKKREFWLMGIAAFCTFFSILGASNNMILHVQSLGLGVARGAALMGYIFFGGLIGKLLAGWLTDLFGRRPVWIGSLLLMLVGAGLLATMSSALLPIAIGAFGLGWGANYTLLQAIAGDVFGTRSLGRVMGAVTVLDAGGGALGPWVTAKIADGSGSYQLGFVTIGLLIAIALVCASLLNVRTPDAEVRRS